MQTPPTLRDLTAVFARIGIASFGGPAAQIALMHRELVDERRWLGEKDFLSALSFCMLLPGPEAMQLATYAGWKLHGTRGGLIAGGLFVLPGAVVVLALSAAYAAWGGIPQVEAAFLGIKAAVLAIVVQALIRVAGRALIGPAHRVIAALSFVAIFALALPYPLIVAAAAVWGALTATGVALPAPAPRVRGLVRTVAVWLGLWAAPLVALWAAGATLLTEIGLFFSKLAVVTFGGAYAVLAYMAQEVVEDRGWLTAAEMVDGLGLAETTPGPLILVTEFVGFMAGFRADGLPMALAAAAVTLWVTFVPCFLWIFAGAPFLSWIAGRPRLNGALAAVTAAVVGVILNLSLWFAAHVLFAEVGRLETGPLSVIAPAWASLDPAALGLAILSAVLLFGFRVPLLGTLGISALSGLAIGALT